MNHHAHNMKEICQAFHDHDAETVQMTVLEPGGCMMQASNPDACFYFSFPSVAKIPAAYKGQIIKLLHKARKMSQDSNTEE